VGVAERAPSAQALARSYLATFAAACSRASETAGAISHDLRIGGASVRLRFAGPALVAQLLPALAHLRVEAGAGAPDLTIELWDAESTGVTPPRFPWRQADVRARGEIRGFNDGGIRTVVHGGIAPTGHEFLAVTMFDEAARVARFFVRAANDVPWYERAAPLRTPLHWGLRTPSRLLVHAGAVGLNGRGVLLAGPSGSGKSTTAVAALLAGFDYVGDDYVLLDLSPRHPAAHSLYASAKLVPATGNLLPELAGVAGAPVAAASEKTILDVSELWPESLCDRLEIVAVVVPRLAARGSTRLRPDSGGQALLALAPSTIFQVPSERAALSPLAELVRSVPSYALELAGDPARAAGLLGDLIEAQPRP
jgi:hypothetical protein